MTYVAVSPSSADEVWLDVQVQAGIVPDMMGRTEQLSDGLLRGPPGKRHAVDGELVAPHVDEGTRGAGGGGFGTLSAPGIQAPVQTACEAQACHFFLPARGFSARVRATFPRAARRGRGGPPRGAFLPARELSARVRATFPRAARAGSPGPARPGREAGMRDSRIGRPKAPSGSPSPPCTRASFAQLWSTTRALAWRSSARYSWRPYSAASRRKRR